MGVVKYKFAGYSIDKYLNFENGAFYLFFYHIVISGIVTYLEYIGSISVIPFRTLFLFAIPFTLFAIVYVARFFTERYRPRYFFRNLTFALVIGYLLSIVILNTSKYGLTSKVTSYNLVVLFWYIVAYMIGSRLQIKTAYRRLITIAYMLMVLNVVVNTSLSTFLITIPYDQLGIFHFLGDGFAIWSLLMISLYKDRLSLIVIILVSTICLYIISSRTSLYAFLLLLPFVFRKNKSWVVRVFFIAGILVLLGLIVANFDEFSKSRMLRFVFTGEDHSFYLREKILERNSQDLYDNWLFGDYAGQLRHGVFGLYIHNYLSLWRQFGIIPFVLFIVLLFPFFQTFIPWFRGKKHYQQYDFVFYFTIFCLVEIIFTRSYKFHFVWLAIGMMTHMVKKERLGGATRTDEAMLRAEK